MRSVANSPLQIIEALELTKAIDLAGMADRRIAFRAVHMGVRDLRIGKLLDLIQTDTALCPPRTGHIGNWGSIAEGRAGAMDFNRAICGPGYGYPLIYGFNQTEVDATAIAAAQGDWGYLPGSFIDRDIRTPLVLQAWNGTEFARCGRDTPRFTPFIQAEQHGGLKPLTTLHRQRMEALPQFQFTFEQALLAANEVTIRPWLTVLFDEARQRDNPKRALQDLVGHAVALDGTITRTALEINGRGFKLGESYFPSIEALVDFVLVPFRAVADPEQFMADIGRMPPYLPVASTLLITVLSALLETHCPDRTWSGAEGPLNPHLHWGGRDMAGYPPRRNGYLLEDAKIRSLKSICKVLVTQFAGIKPLCFVLLPATVFMLSPASTHPGDAELLSRLFRQVRDLPGAATMQRDIEATVQTWHDAHGPQMSAYFLDRFGPRRGGLPADSRQASSDPVEPEGFRELSLRQASMIVGALYETRLTRSTQP
jgi:hypothetical protein